MLEDKWVVIKERLEPVLDPRKLVGGTIGEERQLAFHPQEFYNFPAKMQQNTQSGMYPIISRGGTGSWYRSREQMSNRIQNPAKI